MALYHYHIVKGLIGLAALAVTSVVGYKTMRRDGQGLKRVAKSDGLTYKYLAPLSKDIVKARFYALKATRYVHNVFAKEENGIHKEAFSAMLYRRTSFRDWFSRRIGNRIIPYRATVIYWSDSLDLPELRLRPEEVGDTIKSLAGFDDIDFHDDKAFSDAFHLTGKDKARVKERFTPAFRKFLVERPTLHLEVKPKGFLCYCLDRALTPENAFHVLAEAEEIYQHMIAPTEIERLRMEIERRRAK